MHKLLPMALVLGFVVAAQPTPARADFGLGLFLGDPTGLDMKVGLSGRSGLDILFGFTNIHGNTGYGHLTYLVTPVVAQGSSVLVPVRLGIGAALYGPSSDINFAARAPFEVGLRLRRTPLEIYGEIALLLTLFEPVHADVQAGLGFRVFL